MGDRQKIAISGAGGFIGSFLSTYFSERGYDVIPLHREIFRPENKQELSQILASSAVVINLAGAPILHRWTSSYKREMLESRIHTTRSIVEAIHSNNQKPVTFVSASAIGFYDTDDCYDEYNAKQGNGFLADICEQWEKEALQASPEVRTVITRFGVIFAPHGGAFEKMALSARLKVSTVLGPGSQSLSWMSLKDLARAMEFLIDRPELSGVFNFTVPEKITYEDFGRLVGKHYKTFFTFPVPEKLLQIVLGEASTFITDNLCVIPTRLQEEGFEYKDPTLEEFLNFST